VRTADDVEKELREISEYRELEQSVHHRVRERQYTPETLQETSDLLKKNPEYYTIWNYRRLIRRHHFSLAMSGSTGQAGADQIVAIIQTDLEFLFPLLRRFPKCYWIWNYRLWLLDEAKRLLPKPIARGFWQNELALVGKMLNADSRNFMGWGYRRFVVQALEELMSDEDGSITQSELDYTTKMVKANLSNFSAWHNRSKLIHKLLNERSASDGERKKMLDEGGFLFLFLSVWTGADGMISELDLVHRALIDPYDQSLWFYHQYLMSTFDPTLSAQTMAPNLSNSERLEYIQQEKEAIEDMLDGAEDCKWIYQALIYCNVMVAKIQGVMASEAKAEVSRWLNELMKLDPLRRGRWLDLENSLRH
jgi:geranylgeranyl transferase type-2 subunit alpha